MFFIALISEAVSTSKIFKNFYQTTWHTSADSHLQKIHTPKNSQHSGTVPLITITGLINWLILAQCVARPP
jgi:hypothetical protein